MALEKIVVIIPAFNEDQSIRNVIHKVLEVKSTSNLNLTPVVINDCSSDRTAEIISEENCVAINLPVNLGIGGAMQTGFKYAWENGFDYAIQIDGDGQHPPEEIPKLLNALHEKNLDIVIGSRFISKEGFQSTFFRRMGIAYFKWLNKIFCGSIISDSTSGMRMINRKAMAIACEYYPDEYPEPESILLFSIHKLRIGEVPVIMKERQGGVSSIRSFGSVYYMLKVSLAIIFTFIRLKFGKPTRNDASFKR